MQTQEEDRIPLEELNSWGAEHIASTSKNVTIIRSSSAIISLVSSTILIWILKRSNAGFSSIYHRIILGMSIGDILYSLSNAHFNSTTPSDVDYWVWNARGNQATCSAQGFVFWSGAFISTFYACSLNLYSLAVVKYNKRDSYIRTKIEPFLHGVPIGWGLIDATILIFNKNLNSQGGNCFVAVYEPPHCNGYADGEVRDGFQIPCGRGRDGAVGFYYFTFLIPFFAVPVIVTVSLWMIYRAVKRQEQVNERYGAGVFATNAAVHQTSSGTTSDEDEGSMHRSWLDRLRIIIRSAVSSFKNIRLCGQSSSTSNSRTVLRRALAFAISYLLTWSFGIIGVCFDFADKDWPVALTYLSNTFNPLQGFFNLCIFLQPKVSKIKSRRGNDMTWCQAVMEAILSSGNGGQAPGRGGGGGGGPTNRAQRQQGAQPVGGESKDSSLKEAQSVPLEAAEGVQEAHGVDGPHVVDAPSFGGNTDRSDTMDPQFNDGNGMQPQETDKQNSTGQCNQDR